MLRVRAVRSPCSKWMTRTTIASSKIFRFRKKSIAWPLTSKPTAFTRRNRKRVAKPLRAWWFTKLWRVEFSDQPEKIDIRSCESAAARLAIGSDSGGGGRRQIEKPQGCGWGLGGGG